MSRESKWLRRGGGGDSPLTNIQYFRYRFCEAWYHRFLPAKVRIKSDFSASRNILLLSENGGSFKTVLRDAPFLVNGINVVGWLREQKIKGRVYLSFATDSSLSKIMHNGTEYTMTAKFTDPKLAMLFKLVFG